MTDNNRDNEQICRTRGKLKVFLGAVPGVGKTYKMLSEAHRRLSRGEDIVIGLVETHGRAATAKMTEGLEQVPLKHINYRGSAFAELDTSTIIARKPEWVLVDELAHTNIPGTVHAKRWQSVEDILKAGINVVSTVNVQHMESLNDVVFDITGIRVRETLPDSVIDNANEVELVDLTPDALINRLKRGDIYKAEKVPQALSNFFRKGNIVALRELALRKTSEEVDEQLREYTDKLPASRCAQDNILVCITPRPAALKLVRRGYRMSSRLQADFACLYVDISGALRSQSEDAILREAKELCRNLGGSFEEIRGDSAAEEIVRCANNSATTFIIIGQSAPSRLQEILRGSVVNRIMRETRNIDIIVVSDADENCRVD